VVFLNQLQDFSGESPRYRGSQVLFYPPDGGFSILEMNENGTS